jgi:D-sedoheptulose 7-phosphate isomerase/D-glycero-D-manno-heptose 1,7-bisphosphate phosphatase
MNSFPIDQYTTAGAYLDDYARQLSAAITTVSREAMNQAASLITAALKRDATIFACGNGGSAAIADHLACDHQKGVHRGTHYRPRVVSLVANVSLLTAVGNDVGYAETFALPLSLHGRPGDLLITISSSGNSENIVRALEVAQSLGVQRVTMTGFHGGRSRAMADANIHVDAHNYGIVEDAHQACMHILAQYVRQAAMSAAAVRDAVF